MTELGLFRCTAGSAGVAELRADAAVCGFLRRGFDTWRGEWVEAGAAEAVVIVGSKGTVALKVPGMLRNDTACLLRTLQS